VLPIKMYVENNCKKEAAYCVQSCSSTNGATARFRAWPLSEEASIFSLSSARRPDPNYPFQFLVQALNRLPHSSVVNVTCKGLRGSRS
jgi:hypothetical protein